MGVGPHFESKEEETRTLLRRPRRRLAGFRRRRVYHSSFGTTFGCSGIALVGRRHDLHAVLVEDVEDVAVQIGVGGEHPVGAWRSTR